MSDETKSYPAKIIYGSMEPIRVSPEEADRVQQLLPGAAPINDWANRQVSGGAPVPTEKVITVEDVQGDTHDLWLSPGITFAISRPTRNRKTKAPRAVIL